MTPNDKQRVTYRELLKSQHPEKVDEMYTGGCSGCPASYKYAPAGDGLCQTIADLTPDDAICGVCWDRVVSRDDAEHLGIEL